MSLQQWANNGWVKAHQTSPKEIQDLLKIVKRDLADAAVGDLSADWRFGIACQRRAESRMKLPV